MVSEPIRSKSIPAEGVNPEPEILIESPGAPVDGITFIDDILKRFSIPSNAPPSKALVKPISKKSLFGIIPLSSGTNSDCVP